ncbi:MAG: hypothetical protein R3219_07920, partial [Hydrogenovibrio sp.]|nr:hypothetical protein [Hydrogenovibrio sp.]
FLLVFAAGFALGTVRVLWLVPAIGERAAELAEMPLMWLAIYYSARFIVTRHQNQLNACKALLSGGFALGLLIAIELTLVLGLRGLTVEQYWQSRDPVSGSVYLLSLMIFMFMPWLIRKQQLRHGI